MTYNITLSQNHGFFSDFNTISACLHYLRINEIRDFKVTWNNYFLQSEECNLFDRYFFQSKSYDYYDIHTHANSFWSPNGFWKHTNEHSTYVDIHETLRYFGYFNSDPYLSRKERIEKSNTIDDNTLGVHIRRTDHILHGNYTEIEKYIDQINRGLNDSKYSKVFLATDDQNVLLDLKSLYGDALVYHSDMIRSFDGTPVHLDFVRKDKEKIAEDAYLEAITLSMCKEIIVTSSNLSAFSIYCNPNVKYNFVDSHISYH